MNTQSFALLVVIASLLLLGLSSFKTVPSKRSINGASLFSKKEQMGLFMADKEVVVVGAAGGVVESILKRIQTTSPLVSAVLDSPPMTASSTTKVYYEEAIESSFSLKNKIVVLVAEKGVEDEQNKSEEIIGKVAKLIKSSTGSASPASVVVVTSVASMEEGGGLLSIFGGDAISSTISSLRSISESESFPVSVLLYGDLIEEPEAPFLSAPMLEPKLHPAYVLQSVLFQSRNSNQYAKTEKCTSFALSEAISRLIGMQIKHMSEPSLASSPLPALESEDVVVASIVGPSPGEKDWASLFQRVLNAANPDAEVLRLEFGDVLKKQAFLKWIANTWFPQAIIEADAATILSGARPTRAVLKADADMIRLEWEDMDLQTLSPKKVGALEVQLITGESASLVVRRKLQQGSDTRGGLPGEALLMDKLVEGVNKVAYKKSFCTPVGDSTTV